mgnify:CR=1 FL=1
MRIVPSTRTKDDANKELHEIELAINGEKAKLESISRERALTEGGFSAREKRCNDAEIKCRKTLNEFNEVVSAKEKEIKILDNHISESNSRFATIKEDHSVFVESYRADKKHRLSVLKELKDSIEMIEKDLVNLDSNVVSKNNKIEELRDEIMSLEAKKDEVIKETTIAHSSLDEKRGKIESREIELENKKSNLRTISVRLHQKYGSMMSEFEITQTTI